MFPFNIRIYGILINEYHQVLLSDERKYGYSFTKFPGGGLLFGEGFKEALVREFREELNIEISVGDLFYFNDHHQISFFNQSHQVHAFYYFIEAKDWQLIPSGAHSIPLTEDGEKHRWELICDLIPEMFTFPMDKKVVEKLRSLS